MRPEKTRPRKQDPDGRPHCLLQITAKASDRNNRQHALEGITVTVRTLNTVGALSPVWDHECFGWD